MGHVNGVHEAPQQVHFSKEHRGTPRCATKIQREIHRRDRRPFVIVTVDKYAIRGTWPLDSAFLRNDIRRSERRKERSANDGKKSSIFISGGTVYA